MRAPQTRAASAARGGTGTRAAHLLKFKGRSLGRIDGTDPVSRTRAYVSERGNADGTLELFRRYWPGTRHATLRAVASSLGVR